MQKKHVFYDKYYNDVRRVQELGGRIGYGHLMSLAHSLWKKALIDAGYPDYGAFIPVIEPMLKDGEIELLKPTLEIYDSMVAEALKSK